MNYTKITDFPCSCSYVHTCSTCIYFVSRSHAHWCCKSDVVIKETIKNHSGHLGNLSETIFSEKLRFCMLSACALKFQHMNLFAVSCNSHQSVYFLYIFFTLMFLPNNSFI